MLDRLINIFFLFSLVFIFILIADASEHFRMLIALVLSFVVAYLAFILNWLTLDGVNSAILFGLIAFGLGSTTGACIVLAFFITSSLLSKDMISEESLLSRKFRRDGIQVWSNGFWFAFWVIVWFLTKEQVFLIAGVASMAAATADTWASEIGGNRIKGKTWMITSFRTVLPGMDGGISIVGSLAALLGAFFIGGLFWILNPETKPIIFFLIAIAGFFGSFADSWFGAKVQGNELNKGLKNLFARRVTHVDNNIVNWMAAGSASFAALLAMILIEN